MHIINTVTEHGVSTETDAFLARPDRSLSTARLECRASVLIRTVLCHVCIRSLRDCQGSI